MRNVEANRFEDFVQSFSFRKFEYLVAQQANIDDADDLAFAVDGRLGDGDNTGNHYVRQALLWLGGQQTARWENSCEAIIFIHGIKIDDLFTDTSLADNIQGLLHVHVLSQSSNIFSSDGRYRPVQVIWIVHERSLSMKLV